MKAPRSRKKCSLGRARGRRVTNDYHSRRYGNARARALQSPVSSYRRHSRSRRAKRASSVKKHKRRIGVRQSTHLFRASDQTPENSYRAKRLFSEFMGKNVSPLQSAIKKRVSNAIRYMTRNETYEPIKPDQPAVATSGRVSRASSSAASLPATNWSISSMTEGRALALVNSTRMELQVQFCEEEDYIIAQDIWKLNEINWLTPVRNFLPDEDYLSKGSTFFPILETAMENGFATTDLENQKGQNNVIQSALRFILAKESEFKLSALASFISQPNPDLLSVDLRYNTNKASILHIHTTSQLGGYDIPQDERQSRFMGVARILQERMRQYSKVIVRMYIATYDVADYDSFELTPLQEHIVHLSNTEYRAFVSISCYIHILCKLPDSYDKRNLQEKQLTYFKYENDYSDNFRNMNSVYCPHSTTLCFVSGKPLEQRP